MADHDPIDTIRALRFHDYGEPADVLRLDTIEALTPAPGRIRIAGTADWASFPSAGAADQATMDHWASVPDGLNLTEAAALPMALETADRSLDQLRLSAGQTILVHGGGTTVGYAAVQIALLRGARVITTAGDTYAPQLADLGATVTAYGDGMAERVAAVTGSTVDLVFDTSPVGGALPDLVRIAGGDPKRVLSISRFVEAESLGARHSFHEDGQAMRFDVFGDFARLAAEGRFAVPIAATFFLGGWRTASGISLGGHAHGKLLLLPGEDADK